MSCLTGITLIRNGNALKYPWKECISSMCDYCDEVLVNVDVTTTDQTEEDAALLADQYDNLMLYAHQWNMSNTGDGHMLADEANKLLPHAITPWILYLQADEFLLEEDGRNIKQFLQQLPDEITQVELYRTYFWGDLETRAPEHELWLGRIFRSGSHTIGGDGMYLIRQYGSVQRYGAYIYHYSRMGTEEDVTKRWRNLDTLFHEQHVVDTFNDFTYGSISSHKLIKHKGTKHPKGIKKFYENM